MRVTNYQKNAIKYLFRLWLCHGYSLEFTCTLGLVPSFAIGLGDSSGIRLVVSAVWILVLLVSAESFIMPSSAVSIYMGSSIASGIRVDLEGSGNKSIQNYNGTISSILGCTFVIPSISNGHLRLTSVFCSVSIQRQIPSTISQMFIYVERGENKLLLA